MHKDLLLKSYMILDVVYCKIILW